MAWLQRDPSNNYHVSFRFGGLKFKRSLRTKKENEAVGLKGRIERRIQLVQSGDLALPDNVDIAEFFLSNGNGKPKISQAVCLADLCDQFFDSIPNGNVEANTLKTMKIHTRHLRKHLGDRFRVRSLGLSDLQNYVSSREKEKGHRGREVCATTLKKELTTFSTIWNWAVNMGHVKGDFPRRGLRLPKVQEKPPFQTWQQIGQQLDGNHGDNRSVSASGDQGHTRRECGGSSQ